MHLPAQLPSAQPNDRTVKLRGVRGYVADGGSRDTAFIRRLGFPAWCRYATPADIVGFWLRQDFGEPIVIGSVRIRTGDFLLADDDGVVVIPQVCVSNIIAERDMGRENLIRQTILYGTNLRDA